jgi:hypothetical protein
MIELDEEEDWSFLDSDNYDDEYEYREMRDVINLEEGWDD